MSVRYGLAVLCGVCILLQGCAALVVGAGVGAMASAHDRRTLGTQIDDKTTGSKIITALSQVDAIKQGSNINVHVFNGNALLVGQAPTADISQQAERIANNIKSIRKVFNQIRVAIPVASSTAANDLWLASKVRGTLLKERSLEGLHISVTVEDSEVFLMGLVTRVEADKAVEITRNINGVARVIKAFEYL